MGLLLERGEIEARKTKKERIWLFVFSVFAGLMVFLILRFINL